MIKLCIDCKYHKKVFFTRDYCRSPNNTKIDLVNGKKFFIEDDCTTNRLKHSGCGVFAKWFVKKEAK